MNMSRQIIYALLICILSGCASTLNVLDKVQRGQTQEQAIEAVDEMANAAPAWTIENGKTTFLIYGFIATFLDMYDNTMTYYYVKLEDGKVVDKGMVSRKQREEIKAIDPDFDTDQLIRRPHPPADS